MIAAIALLLTSVAASNTSYVLLVAATARPFERLEELGNRSTAPGAFRFPGEHHYHRDDEFPANIRTLCATGRPFVFAVGDAHEASLARPRRRFTCWTTAWATCALSVTPWRRAATA